MAATRKTWAVIFMDIQLTLTTLTYGGDAMGRHEGKAVFVPFALPGETVRARIVEDRKNFTRAELLQVITPAQQRIAPKCAHFGACSGCHYQHLPYTGQLAAKSAILRDQLQRIGKIEAPPVSQTVSAPQTWGYRVQTAFLLDAEGRLSFQAVNGDALPVSECPLLTGPLAALWPQVEAGSLPSLDLLTFRQGAADDLMLILESADPTPPELELEADISIAHLYADHAVVLAGDDHGVVEVNGRDFRVSAASAFPDNPAMTGRIIAHVLSLLPSAPNFIVDVFAGVGLFSAFLAPRCQRLAAIEDLPAAAEDFATNLDDFENIELYEAAPSLALPALGARPDMVILQPGADGLERDDLDALLDLSAPTLCYISSDPSTLARDAARLIAGGYRLEQSTPFDVMPHTARIDSVSIFAR